MSEQNPINNQNNLSPKRAMIMGGIFVAVGIFIILVGAGIVPANPETKHAPAWVIACAGLEFMLCGAAVINGFAVAKGVGPDGNFAAGTNPAVQSVQDFLGLAIIGLLAAIAGWVSFGPGQRQFTSGSNSYFNPGSPISSGSGRLAFGAGFVVLALIFILFTVKIIKRLRGRAAKGPLDRRNRNIVD